MGSPADSQVVSRLYRLSQLSQTKNIIWIRRLFHPCIGCFRVIKFLRAETVVRRCSVKEVILEILQNPQENTCARVSFLIKLQAFQNASCGCFCQGFIRSPWVYKIRERWGISSQIRYEYDNDALLE